MQQFLNYQMLKSNLSTDALILIIFQVLSLIVSFMCYSLASRRTWLYQIGDGTIHTKSSLGVSHWSSFSIMCLRSMEALSNGLGTCGVLPFGDITVLDFTTHSIWWESCVMDGSKGVGTVGILEYDLYGNQQTKRKTRMIPNMT